MLSHMKVTFVSVTYIQGEYNDFVLNLLSGSCFIRVVFIDSCFLY